MFRDDAADGRALHKLAQSGLAPKEESTNPLARWRKQKHRFVLQLAASSFLPRRLAVALVCATAISSSSVLSSCENLPYTQVLFLTSLPSASGQLLVKDLSLFLPPYPSPSPGFVDFFTMADRYIPEHRRTQFKAKSSFKPEDLRRRRGEQQIEIRKQRREENLAKRRGIQTRDGQVGVEGGAAGLDSDEESAPIETEVCFFLHLPNLPLVAEQVFQSCGVRRQSSHQQSVRPASDPPELLKEYLETTKVLRI